MVTQTTLVKTRKLNEPWKRYPGPCYSVVNQIRTCGHTSVVTNNKDSRPYPSNLINALTASPTQSTTVYNYGLVSDHFWDYCPGYYGSTVWTERLTRRPWSSDSFILPDVNLENEFNLRARLKIKDRYVNLGASCFEFRETASLFAQTAKEVFWLARAVWRTRKGTVAPLRHYWHMHSDWTLRDVSSKHLGIAYGVAPLLGDLSDSVEKLSLLTSQPLFRKVRVTVKGDGHKTQEFASGKGEGWKILNIKGQIYVRLDPNNNGNFTMGNPLEVAWELVPFSFVIDSLIGVGDWLSALDALKGVSYMTGTKTYRETSRSLWEPSGLKVYEKSERLITSHRRELIGSLPLPWRPLWKPSSSWKTIMNHSMLLWDLVQRR